MESALYRVAVLLFLSAPPLLHEPFPEELRGPSAPTQLQSLLQDGTFKKGPAVSRSGPAAPRNRHKGQRFQLKKLEKAGVFRRDKRGRQAQSMILDAKTNIWDPPRNSVKSLYTPPVYPNERIWVHDKIHIGKRGELVSSPSKRSIRALPATSRVVPEKNRFFWGRFTPKRGRGYVVLPSVSPHMKIVDVVEQRARGLEFWRDGNGVYYIGPLSKPWISQVLHVRIAAPSLYFSGLPFPETTFPKRGTFPGARRLRDLSHHTFGRPGQAHELLNTMVDYFRGFKVEALEPRRPGEPLYEAVFRQKKGVCRHRALLFMGLAQAYGFETRLVFNTVHAFCELRLPGEKLFRRVDLGEARLPAATRRPQSTPRTQGKAKESALRYRYRLAGPASMMGKGRYRLTIRHLTAPPPLLWIALVDPQGTAHFTQRLLPTFGRGEQTVTILLPESIRPGRYKYVLLPQ